MGRRILLWSVFFILTLVCSCTERGHGVTKRLGEISMALAEVRKMDSCRVVASNRDFYLHKYKVEKTIEKYSDTRGLTAREALLLTKARSGVAYAYTDYLLQIGKHDEAYNVMHRLALNTSINLYSDTTQWLNFLYHQGEVHYSPYFIEKNKRRILQGYDNIVQGYILSSRLRNDFYQGKFMLLLSMYFLNDSITTLANDFDKASIRYINEDGVPDSLLAGNMAERSLSVFLRLNQPYYTAEAWLSLARCYFKLGDARESVQCLNMALANPATDSMPDLRATISEQLSLSYAALDDKHNSDLYRNEYLDLQDSTRQDRELEARVVSLEKSTGKLWGLAAVAGGLFVMLVVATLVLVRMRKRQERKAIADDEELEILQEGLQANRVHLSDAMRATVEQRARLAVVTGMIPLIDRMAIAARKGDDVYVRELSEEIERQNALITKWIKMRKGVIQPHIENFLLKDVFDIVGKNPALFESSRITLTVSVDNDVKVKADKTLTLFIINTLVDNARKAITGEGEITISGVRNEENSYVEISVSDTGVGMDSAQLEHLFEYKVITDGAEATSHGFGLANCRGIIDRYRKISSLFSVCDIFASSRKGEGTTVSFRLPLCLRLLLLFLVLPFGLTHASGSGARDNDDVAARYCDSLYKCNVDGRYDEAMKYADSCYAIVRENPNTDIGIRLSLYNETAVAAMALHQWKKYAFFNYYYISLYKDYTSDSTIATYCEKMERNEYWANVAIVVTVVLLLALVPIFWFVYLRHILSFHREVRTKKTLLEEETHKTGAEVDRLHLSNNIMDNQLSALKHETMYYPVRILQLLDTGGDERELMLMVDYYDELYKTLCLHAMSGVASAYAFTVRSMPLRELFRLDADGTCDDIKVIANRELTDYLHILLRRSNRGKTPGCSCVVRDKDYVELRFLMDNRPDLLDICERLFSTDTPDVEFLVMRQIVREIASSSLRYASGIMAERDGLQFVVKVVMPVGR